MCRFAGWLVRFFGPFDKRLGSHAYPGIGNSHLPRQYCERLLGFASELSTMDPLRRGYLADQFFSPLVDYTRSEVPVTLKLQHGRLWCDHCRSRTVVV